MNSTPNVAAEPNNQPVLQAGPAWLPSVDSIAGPPPPPTAIPAEVTGKSFAAVTPKRSRRRLVGLSLGRLVVAAALIVGMVSDIGTRQSLGSTQKQLAALNERLTVANEKLTAANAIRDNQTAQISDLDTTVSTQQQQLATVNAQEQQLTACVGAASNAFKDIAANSAGNVIVSDYNKAYTVCAAAGQTLP